MSFLTLPKNTPDFSKAVISLWFRVPQASLTAAAKDVPKELDFNMPLRGIIPFITFGPNESISFHQVVDGEYAEVGNSHTGPSFIGLKCYEDDNPSLMVKLQTSTMPPLKDKDFGFVFGTGIDGTGDYFAVGDFPYYGLQGNFSAYIEPEPDTWHHLLVSFDVGLPITTPGSGSGFEPNLFTSACKFWWAYDDVNYDGHYLWPYGLASRQDTVTGAPYVGDPHFVLSAYCFGAGTPIPGPSGGTVIQPFSFAFPPLPNSAHPCGLPSEATWTNKIYRVEMAELQVFTGVTLDTAVTKNRRVFIGADGTPVDPTKGTTEDDPTPPAEKLLGKKPDILLHGSSDWIDGKNTGSIGIDVDGKVKPAGQFTPTGGINQYTPDPALEDSTP